MFFPPIPLIRKKRIIHCLIKSGATTKENAKSIDEIGLINPYAFSNILKRLIKKEIVFKTEDNKYYLNK